MGVVDASNKAAARSSLPRTEVWGGTDTTPRVKSCPQHVARERGTWTRTREDDIRQGFTRRVYCCYRRRRCWTSAALAAALRHTDFFFFYSLAAFLIGLLFTGIVIWAGVCLGPDGAITHGAFSNRDTTGHREDTRRHHTVLGE